MKFGTVIQPDMSVIYKSKRIGQYGKEFTLYKFRTMVEGADRLGGSSTADNDPRITRTGYMLRKTHLDEIPQIINVIKGNMAFIGWRPEAPEYLDTIPKQVLATKPGIIGLATLWDHDEGKFLLSLGAIDPDRAYREHILPKKRELELYYAQHRSWRLNLWIILKTTQVLLGKFVGRF